MKEWKWNTKNKAIDFLLYSYFGIKSQEDVVPDNQEDLILKCAQRAYMDLCRTLRFRESPNANGLKKAEKEQIEKSHRDFCDAISKMIRESILEDLLTAPDKDSFNQKHQGVCTDICEMANTTPIKGSEETVLKKRFRDGQAQKWLNMTMKYMWLLGLFDDRPEWFLSVMHAPVDNYIIKAAPEGVNPSKRSWSTWDYEEDYKPFQEDLKKKLQGEPPIEWEYRAWMESERE